MDKHQMASESDTEDSSSVFTRTTAPTEWDTDSSAHMDTQDDTFSIGTLYVQHRPIP